MSSDLSSTISVLSADLVKKARSKNMTLATAESCTGGLIGAAITGTAGSSSVFLGGIIAYHNDVKISALGVSPKSLEMKGAVSRDVAMEMAKGCREKLKVDFAVSVTGIAGPGGGTPEKPVGTVWIGLSSEKETRAELYNFPNQSREKVRDETCLVTLRTLLETIS